jgi:isocitrate dehydrogenase kinase/phosphatase
MTQYKVLMYVDNEPTSLSGKIYENISDALYHAEMWQGHKNALFEGVVAVQNLETGNIVSRSRIAQSAERREQLMAENGR